MKDKRRVAILAFDGFMDVDVLETKIRNLLDIGPLRSIVSHIKINDAVHLADCSGPCLVFRIRKIIDSFGLSKDVGIMLDLKFGDTSGTLINYGKHYNLTNLDILTVSSICSTEGLITLRHAFSQSKIALVSVLTEMSRRECLMRWNYLPELKIFRDILFIEECSSKNSRELFDLVVCSPLELPFLRLNLKGKHGFITPGIRDDWMLIGQQNRFTGVRRALETGADYVVLGSQLTAGNPQSGISVEESIRRTIEEIEKASL